MENIMLPSPHKILSIVKETRAEYTFRVAYEGETKHGQFFQLSIPKVGEAPISVSGKGEGYIEFTIRKIGRLTQGIFGLQPGDMLFMRGPYGNAFPIERFKGKDLVVNCVLFSEEIEKFRGKFHVIPTPDNSSAPGFETGMVTAHIGNIPFDSFEDYNVVIVGPPVMMRFAALECVKRGVPEEKIWVSFERRMSCAVGKCGHCKINETYVCLEGPVFNYSRAKDLLD